MKDAIARERRAAAMLLDDPTGVRRLPDGSWLVQSATGRGSYRVARRGKQGRWTCSCRDFLTSGDEPCKHIYRAYLEWFPSARPTAASVERPPEKEQYRQNWSAYDTAQAEEERLFPVLLRALVDTIPEPMRPSSTRGRKPIMLADQAFCAIQKVYSQRSCRRAVGIHRRAVQDGHLRRARAPGYIVSSRFLNSPQSSAILQGLLINSAMPMAGLEDEFAPDATGIQTTSFGAWREESHGERRFRLWLKAHALVGIKTHAVYALAVTEKTGADYNQFTTLIQSAIDRGVVIGSVYADGAYKGRSNFAFADEHGFRLWTRFGTMDSTNAAARNRDAKDQKAHSRQWTKMLHYWRLHHEEYLSQLHKRSNVEAVFSALKRKLGEHVRSKLPRAQENEILAKTIAYNLLVLIHEIYEHGIVPEFLRDAEQLRAAV